MTPISKKKIELFLVLEEIMHQTVVFINLVMALLKENDARTRRLEQHVRRYSMIDRIPNQVNHLRRLVNLGDADCVANLRMTRNAFSRLCYLMEHVGGLDNSKYVSVEEKVAMFLSILSHHKKNRIVKYNFMRSGQTVSKHIHVVLKALLRISSILLVESTPISDNCTHSRWKWFKGCLGALDGTHIRVKVPANDKPRYRTRKGEVAVNVLGVCDRDMKFVYVLPGWEGSAADARVLRDAVNRTHGLKVPKGCYYLCDNGYPNGEGFLTPYKSVRYHLIFLQVDKNARVMRYKSWPYYHDWCEIFGKDRATGEQAEDVMDAVNELFSATKNKEKEVIVDIDLLPHDVNDEIKPDSTYQPVGNDTDKKNGGKKRKLADGSEGLYELLGSFCQNTETRLGDIARRIGYEQDVSAARKEVFEVVGKIGGLTLQEKLLVSKTLVKNTEDLELFSSLPEDARAEFVQMMLAGRL